MKYLHIISLDKFTKGFINFIYSEYNKNEHFFVVSGNDKKYIFEYDNENVLFFKSYKEFTKDKIVKSWAEEANLIIINGLFGNEKCFLRFPLSYLKKTYLMFWGGDFYPLKKKTGLKFIKQNYKKFIIKRALGVINLIEGDYKELISRVNTKAKKFVAPMCDDGTDLKLRKKYSLIKKDDNPIKILLGNSATETNMHFEAIDWLSKFKEQNIQIICPLSYGNMEYGRKVEEYGKSVFGDRFLPVTNYMNLEEYYKFISTIKIAVFNNNRQQAMGNINTLIGMKCKVYIRHDTCMWEQFSSVKGYTVYDSLTIKDESFDDFIATDDELFQSNHEKYFNKFDPSYNKAQWDIVFDSVKA